MGEKQRGTGKIFPSYRKSVSLNPFPVTHLRTEVELMHLLRMCIHYCHVWNTHHWTDSEFAWTSSCTNDNAIFTENKSPRQLSRLLPLKQCQLECRNYSFVKVGKHTRVLTRVQAGSGRTARACAQVGVVVVIEIVLLIGISSALASMSPATAAAQCACQHACADHQTGNTQRRQLFPRYGRRHSETITRRCDWTQVSSADSLYLQVNLRPYILFPANFRLLDSQSINQSINQYILFQATRPISGKRNTNIHTHITTLPRTWTHPHTQLKQ